MHEKITGSLLPSTAALAFVGDARHSLYVRKMLVGRGITKSGELNEMAQRYVTAEAQAAAFRRIEHLLLEDELDCYRRAANSKHLNKPKHASGADYRSATGFEAVIGMLDFLNDNERIEMLLGKATEDVENDSEN